VSNIAAEPTVQVCQGRPDAGPVRELLPARAVPLGESTVVRRLLPTMGRVPTFEHHHDLPVLREPGAAATVLLGELAGARSPGQVHTALIGVDVTLERGADAVLPLEGDFEHAMLTVSGAPEVDGGELEPGSLCYLGTGRSTLRLRADTPSRLLLLGGIPFTEKIVMWWNFIARTPSTPLRARGRTR
jgi:redox-sensitive bicupin YhaK (pirin superfamily)